MWITDKDQISYFIRTRFYRCGESLPNNSTEIVSINIETLGLDSRKYKAYNQMVSSTLIRIRCSLCGQIKTIPFRYYFYPRNICKRCSNDLTSKTYWKGHFHTEEAKDKCRLSRLGKPLAEETKRKMSLKTKGRPSPLKGRRFK